MNGEQRHHGWVRPTARYVARERELIRALRKDSRGKDSFIARLEVCI